MPVRFDCMGVWINPSFPCLDTLAVLHLGGENFILCNVNEVRVEQNKIYADQVEYVAGCHSFLYCNEST